MDPISISGSAIPLVVSYPDPTVGIGAPRAIARVRVYGIAQASTRTHDVTVADPSPC